MITHLHIKDFILIDHLEWDLREGFTSITGETGAGKSIIIGAIELLLGGRADTVSYTHLTLPTKLEWCRSRWSPYH